MKSIVNRRFQLDEKGNVADKLCWLSKVPWCSSDERHPTQIELRERVLEHHLLNLVDDLASANPIVLHSDGHHRRSRSEEVFSLFRVLHSVIRSSKLSKIPSEVSSKRRSSGRCRPRGQGRQTTTSLRLFVDDVERLLRNIYGASECRQIERLCDCLLVVTREFTRHIKTDLYEEHCAAETIDFGFSGIGIPDGYGISGSDFRSAQMACFDLELRARAVCANPNRFSKYTVEFANVFLRDCASLKSAMRDKEEDAELDRRIQSLLSRSDSDTSTPTAPAPISAGFCEQVRRRHPWSIGQFSVN